MPLRPREGMAICDTRRKGGRLSLIAGRCANITLIRRSEVSIDADNLRKVAAECRTFLRDDIVEAMDAAAAEIDRLGEVIIRYQKERREMRRIARR